MGCDGRSRLPRMRRQATVSHSTADRKHGRIQRCTRQCHDAFDARWTNAGASAPVRAQGSHWRSQLAPDSDSAATREGRARHCQRAAGRACAERVRRTPDRNDRSWAANERGVKTINPEWASNRGKGAIEGRGGVRSITSMRGVWLVVFFEAIYCACNDAHAIFTAAAPRKLLRKPKSLRNDDLSRSRTRRRARKGFSLPVRNKDPYRPS